MRTSSSSSELYFSYSFLYIPTRLSGINSSCHHHPLRQCPCPLCPKLLTVTSSEPLHLVRIPQKRQRVAYFLHKRSSNTATLNLASRFTLIRRIRSCLSPLGHGLRAADGTAVVAEVLGPVPNALRCTSLFALLNSMSTRRAGFT